MNTSMNILFSGSRNYNNINNVNNIFQQLLQYKNDITIIVGDCPTGLDKIVKDLCIFHNFNIRIFKADWDKYGKAAGPIRNREMFDMTPYRCYLFAENINNTKGTKNMLNILIKNNYSNYYIIT